LARPHRPRFPGAASQAARWAGGAAVVPAWATPGIAPLQAGAAGAAGHGGRTPLAARPAGPATGRGGTATSDIYQCVIRG
jgi:hypothetical protein